MTLRLKYKLLTYLKHQAQVKNYTCIILIYPMLLVFITHQQIMLVINVARVGLEAMEDSVGSEVLNSQNSA